MKKLIILSIILLFILVFSSQIILANSFNLNIGEEYFSLSITGNNNYIIGFGIGLTNDDVPEYTSLEGEPYHWWESKGEKNTSNEAELFLGRNIPLTKNLHTSLAAGVAYQEKTHLYYSPASGLYFGDDSGDYEVTLQGGIKYLFSNSFNLKLGYHSIYGGLIGFNLRF